MPWISSVGLRFDAHQLDGLEQLAQAFQREELALQRHHHRIGGGHGIDGEQVERRRAIDQHIGEVHCGPCTEYSASASFRMKLRRGLSIRSPARRPTDRRVAGTSDKRGCWVGTMASRQLAAPSQHVIGGDLRAARDRCPGRSRHCPGGRCRSPDLLADGGQRGAEIDGGRGLTDAALLIGDDQDARLVRGFGGSSSHSLELPSDADAAPKSRIDDDAASLIGPARHGRGFEFEQRRCLLKLGFLALGLWERNRSAPVVNRVRRARGARERRKGARRDRGTRPTRPGSTCFDPKRMNDGRRARYAGRLRQESAPCADRFR